MDIQTATINEKLACDKRTSCDVSVIVPCYNTQRYLKQALSSLLNNNVCDLEILLINDGSTDASLQIMKEFAAKDARIRIIDKQNQGYGASVNRGISEARGVYVAIFEPDDWVDAHMYDDLFALAVRYQFPDIVKSSFWCVFNPDTASEHTEHCSYYKKLCIDSEPFVLKDCPRLLEHHPSIWSALYKKSFLDERHIRFQEVPGAGWVDTPFNFKVLNLASSIVYTDNAYYHYRYLAPGSSSALKSLDLPFMRWQDMHDIAQELNICDAGILKGLYTVGFAYVEDAIANGALQVYHDKALHYIDRLYQQLDSELVKDMPYLSRAARNRYASFMNNSCVAFNQKQHMCALMGDTYRLCRHYGLNYALSRVATFIKHRVQSRH